MSTTYVKNYDIGQIRLDAPHSHFIYELPLLSFCDIQHAINLSLVYQSKMSDNPFYIANGYKLSFQKRIIPSGTTIKLEEGNGTLVNCNRFGNSFTLCDDSKRIIRYVDTKYVLENPDYSREVYNSSGNIEALYDKYDYTTPYMTFEYTSGKMIRATYRTSKVVDLAYTNNKLSSITYSYNGTVICTSTITYTTDLIKVAHYSGVDYHIGFELGNFTAYSTDSVGAYSSNYSHKVLCISKSDKYMINKYIGSKLIDQNSYCFARYTDSTESKFDILETINRHGIRRRVQYENEKPKYSYEVFAVSGSTIPDITFSEGKYVGIVSMYNNDETSGKQVYDDGQAPSSTSGSNSFVFNTESLDSANPYIVLSGWVKTGTEGTTCQVSVNNSGSDNASLVSETFSVDNLPKDRWIYFTHQFEFTGNVLNASVSAASGDISATDFRLSYKTLSTESLATMSLAEEGPIVLDISDMLAKNANIGNNAKSHFTNKDDVLIDASGNNIPFASVTFKNGSTIINESVCANDVIKFKINAMKGLNTSEFYYNDLQGVITDVDSINVEYNGITQSLDNFDVGKRQFTDTKSYLRKISVGASTVTVTNVKNEPYREDDVKILNINLDVTSSTVNEITTTYRRNLKGFEIRKQVGSIMDVYTTYDADITKVLTYKDEFQITTTYTTDDVWGVVTNEVCNGKGVLDDYDGDMQNILSKSFTKTNATPKVHNYTYAGGNLSTLTNDSLHYGFTYITGDLTGISKCDTIIENHSYSNNDKTVTSSYPSSSNPVYTLTKNTDNYGRLVNIEGIVANTHDVNPHFEIDPDANTLEHKTAGIDNGSGMLSTSQDLIAGKTRKFGYEYNKLTASATYDTETGVCLTQEAFSYDEAGRAVGSVFSRGYDSVEDSIEYKTDPDDVDMDNRVQTHSYKVDSVEKCKTTLQYDSYNRLSTKKHEINGLNYYNNLGYYKSRVSSSSLRTGLASGTIHDVAYLYDSHSRMTSELDSQDMTYRFTYSYDGFGQLIRENNKAINKSIVYSYDNIGNITSAKYYAYTENSTVSGDYTEDVYTYDTTHKDRLASFNGKAIAYDALGCPTSYDGWTMTWTRGRLTSMTKTENGCLHSIYYSYDAEGRRIGKNHVANLIVGSNSSFMYSHGTRYEYDLNGRLIMEIRTEQDSTAAITMSKTVYIYDDRGVVGMVYTANGVSSTYYFDKNIKGDVIGIIDENGTVIVKYGYDSWGNFSVLSSTNSTISGANSIRYRSYYLDSETGFYCLGARFYNPKWRRFISPDNIAYANMSAASGLNLYAYCVNNPVMYIDHAGTFAYTFWSGDEGYDPDEELYKSFGGGGGSSYYGGHYGGYYGAGLSNYGVSLSSNALIYSPAMISTSYFKPSSIDWAGIGNSLMDCYIKIVKWKINGVIQRTVVSAGVSVAALAIPVAFAFTPLILLIDKNNNDNNKKNDIKASPEAVADGTGNMVSSVTNSSYQSSGRTSYDMGGRLVGKMFDEEGLKMFDFFE